MTYTRKVVLLVGLAGVVLLTAGVGTVAGQSPSTEDVDNTTEKAGLEIESDTSIEGLNQGYGIEPSLDRDSVDDAQSKTEEITISSPAQVHVPGMGIDMSGTVSPGVNEVSVFVSARGDAFHLTSIDVDSVDNTYEKTNFNPREEAESSVARDMLSQPGFYSYFVVDRADIEEVNRNNPDRNVFGDDGIDTFDLFTGATAHQTLPVFVSSLSAEFEGLTDSLKYEGQLFGPPEFAVVVVDSNGNTVVKKDVAASSGEIDGDIDTSSLTDGDAYAYVITSGRDRIFGDGVFEISEEVAQAAFDNSDETVVNADLNNFVSLVDGIGEVEDDLLSVQDFVLKPVEEAGSDDLLIGQGIEIESGDVTILEVVTKQTGTDEEGAFTTTGTEVTENSQDNVPKPLSESSTIPEIQEVFPAELRGDTIGIQPVEVGETMVVRGTTDRDADDFGLLLRAVRGPSTAELGVEFINDVGEDGSWEAQFEVSEEVEPGVYTVRAYDGNSADFVDVEILAEGTFLDEGERLDGRVDDFQQRVWELEKEIEFLEEELGIASTGTNKTFPDNIPSEFDPSDQEDTFRNENEPDSFETDTQNPSEATATSAHGNLEAEFDSFDDKIFRSDGVRYRGTLEGSDEFVVVAIGGLGNVVANSRTAGTGGEISETTLDVSSLQLGAEVSILAPNTDEFGDGTITVSERVAESSFGVSEAMKVRATPDNIVALAEGLGEADKTPSQIADILFDQTVEDTESNDLIVADEFQMGNVPFTQVQKTLPKRIEEDAEWTNVFEVGETMVVRGPTNRHHEEATIEVEAVEGPDAEDLGTAVANEWPADGEEDAEELEGIWRVELDIPRDIETGIYTLRADSGDSIDRIDVMILSEGETPDRTVSGVPGMTSDIGQLQRRVANLEERRENLEERRDEPQQGDGDVITEVDPLLEGPVLQGLEIENKYKIGVSTDSTVDSVTLELDGTEYVARKNGSVWETTVDLSNLDSDTVATVTAETTGGETDTEDIRVDVQETPEWLTWLLENNVGTNPDPSWSTGLDSRDFLFEREFVIFGDVKTGSVGEYGEFAVNVGTPFDFGAQLTSRVGVTKPSGDVVLGLGGGGETTVLGVDTEIDISGDANLDQQNKIKRASADIEASAAGISTPWSIKLDFGSLIGFGPSIDLGVTANLGIGGGAEFGKGMSLQSGKIDPVEGGLFAGTEGKAIGFEYKAGGEGSVSGSAEFDIDPTELTSLDVGTQLSLITEVERSFLKLGGEVTIFDATIELIDGQSTLKVDEDDIRVESTGWQVRQKGGTKPVPDVPSVDEVGTADISTHSPIHLSGIGQKRLTDRGLDDTQPTVAETDSETVVVWSRQLQGKNAEDGKDIAYRTKDGSWSSVSTVTDDTKSDRNPDIDGDDQTLLASWTRVDKSLSASASLEDVFNNDEIAVSRYDTQSGTWEDVTLLTDDSTADYSPEVAYSDDQDLWLIAWEADNDVDTSDATDLSVEYAVLDESGTVARNTISDGMSPDAGVDSDGSLSLSYYEPSTGTTSGDVVVGSVDATGTFSEDYRRQSSNFTDLSTDGGEVAWIEGPVQSPRLIYEDSTTTEQLSPSTEMTSVKDPDLEVETDSTVLTYRGVPEGQRGRDIIYRVEQDGEWVADRQIADGLDGDLSVWYPDVTFNSEQDGFSLAYAAEEFDLQNETVNDIFVSSREFAPAYDVDATGPTDASVGDTVNVDYEVRNVGEAEDLSAVDVRLTSDGRTVETQTVGPLGAGEKAEGTFTAQLDETGTFDVVVDATEPDEEWLSTTDEVRLAAPLLGISEVSAERPASNEAVVNVTVANSGGVVAQNVPVTVGDGVKTLRTGTVSSVPANGEASVELTVDPNQIDRTVTDEVVLNADGSLPNSYVDDADRSLFLLRPDLAVTDVEFETDGATVGVENRGIAEAEANVSISRVENGVVANDNIGSTEVTIPAAVGGVPTSETVDIDTDSDLSEGEMVVVSADTVLPDPDTASAGSVEEVTIGSEDEPTEQEVIDAIRSGGEDPNEIERQSLQDAIFEFVAGDGTFNGVELTREGLQSAVFEFVTG